MKNKNWFLVFVLGLLAAACGFSQPPPSGVVKSLNGGADWQFANKYASSSTVSLSAYNISKLDFDPTNRETVFAGSYGGALFKSTDSAQTWKSILSHIFIYDFIINPQDTNTIYVAGTCIDHGCVLKTTNGGASWDSEVYHDGSSSVNAVRTVALNPVNPNQIVIGLASGSVVKSSDGGMSWQLAKDFSDTVNKILWQGPNIYVLLKTKGLFTTTDFGSTFSEVTASLGKNSLVAGSIFFSSNIGEFRQIYVDVSAPTLMYLTTDAGLYKTVDGGKTWSQMVLPIKPDANSPRAIAVARASSNLVFTSIGSTIYKSLDGGGTWQTQATPTAGFINALLIDPQLPQIVYAGAYVSQ